MVGLQFVSQEENGPVFLRCSRDHHNVVLYPTDGVPGLKRVGFEMEDADQLEIAFEHFAKAGLNPKEVSREELNVLKQGRTFRFSEPYTGITMEFYNNIWQMPRDYEYSVTKIKQLGHVVVKVPKFDEALKFLTEVMNFRVSDIIEGGLAWMRCFPNPYHHSFAIAKGNERQFHHMAFMVEDLDDIGIARNRMLQNNIPIVHGPGRHLPSGSVFLYFLDPDELTVEFSLGMEEFPEKGARKPRFLQPSIETIDIWGSKPDPRKAAFGSIEILQAN
jgi:2,3-dihydroxy-p-cumate/2,3-dihydroxybenzoate 3,4-dioxygenase